jgi:phage baseplate assembly protein W
MSSIVITELNKFPVDREYTYRDLEVDLEINYTKTSPLNNFKEQKDIKSDFDIQAIKNSIFNIFTTIPGQKILNPTFGLNLLYYLFTGITAENARNLGETILKGITKFEPRVTVENINVTTDYDNQEYTIEMFLSVPSLNIRGLAIKGTLAESGYYFN